MVVTIWKAVMTLMIFSTQQMFFTGAMKLGVNYGLLGDNLPPPTDVIKLLESYGIQRVRLFDPNPQVLEALRGSDIQVSLGVRNQDLASFADSQQATDDWFATNIKPYMNSVLIYLITVGNEVIPGDNAQYVLPAIQNMQKTVFFLNKMQKTVEAAGLGGQLFVTTVFSTQVLGTSFPPSAGAFAPEIADTMNQIITFIHSQAAPIMINVYPYLALISDPADISLDYALFTSQSPVVNDGGFQYFNLYDAIVDAFYAAIYNVLGSNDFEMQISETGWPSAGNEYATVDNAQTYNNNLKMHVLTQGTPRRPDVLLDTYFFALFNEDQKPAGTEQNFGCFYPDMKPVYPLW